MVTQQVKASAERGYWILIGGWTSKTTPFSTDESKKINMVERTWSQLLEIGYDPIKSRLKVEKPLGNNQVC